MSTSLSIVDEVSPRIAALGNPTPEGRKILNTAMGVEVANEVRNYLAHWDRHRSADALGAKPTQFMRKAADATSSEASENGFTVTIASPGFARVDKDVDIVPVNKMYLTIPIAAEAYGHTIREFPGGAFLRHKGGKGDASLVYGLKSGGDFHPLYVLVKHVHQAQDRTLLPSDEALIAAALEGADEGIADIMEQSHPPSPGGFGAASKL